MADCKLWICIATFLIIIEMVVTDEHIPTTLEGPFEPVTLRFDPSLRRGSDDLPMDHPRLKRNVTSIFPEQISLSISSPTSMWVSWVTGDAQIGSNVTALDPSTVASEVLYGKESGKYSKTQTGASTVYSQLYPFEGLLNYTSGIIHHVRLDGTNLTEPLFMEPLTSRVPMMVIEGNHEIEPQAAGITFKSYRTRFAVPSEECGSNSNFYYSFDAGGVHFVMLGAYVDYNSTGAQYAWLKDDLHKIDRNVTPWLVAAWHPPWYNSYSSHYQEFECMRQEMEALLYQYSVDIVFSGHVHAYERMNRVYNYTLDPCGPVYLTVGDGGNIEKVDVEHADDPGKCPSIGDNVPEFGGVCHLNFSSGPAEGKFCWDKQPEWSAFRESSFGHGILEVVNSTYALWTWHRNQDIYKENSHGDQIYIVRQPQLCPTPTVSSNNGHGSIQVDSGAIRGQSSLFFSNWRLLQLKFEIPFAELNVALLLPYLSFLFFLIIFLSEYF